MEPKDRLIEELARDEIQHARRMTFAQKFLAGAELFDYACSISIAGIRMQHPQFSEEEVAEELRRRLSISDRQREKP